MKKSKEEVLQFIAQNASQYIDISRKIWEFAELSLKEYRSASLYQEKLSENGFLVETNLSNIETAFLGKYTQGEGGPVIGILAEFDALSGLSQKAGSLVREKADKIEDSGHGCGHNMLGAASFGAACGIKHFLEETKTPGTVIFFGCPGEEGGAAKAFLAREGYWKILDAALTWHPGDTNEVTTGTCNSCTQVLYKFTGLAAHAAGNPEEGRSALDAVELMNTGVQYLREHMKKDCYIHYAMVDGGGISPNVVQPHASVLYMVRSCLVKDTLDLQKRVDKIADGAALMTETTYERIFVDGTANTVPNTTLEKVLFENMKEIDLPVYTEEEIAYGKALRATYPEGDRPISYGAAHNEEIAKEVKELIGDNTSPFYDFVMPFYTGNDFTPGSTDVGDVSWLTPTAQFTAVTVTKKAPGHSWQNVSCGATSVGDKGVLYAAKVLAGAAIDLFENPSIIAEAKKEFAERTKEQSYVCPIPDGVAPYIIEE